MKLVDEAGALACMRHAQKRVVTVAVDSMVFREPIKIGDLVILNAEVTYTGRTSMEAEVQVIAENPITGERTHTNTAYLVYVALDDEGRPNTHPCIDHRNRRRATAHGTSQKTSGTSYRAKIKQLWQVAACNQNCHVANVTYKTISRAKNPPTSHSHSTDHQHCDWLIYFSQLRLILG